MKKDTTDMEEYPIDAPIIWYLGIRSIDMIKFDERATEDVIRNILVFLMPCRETERMFPDTNNELTTRTMLTGIEAGRYVRLERKRRMEGESAATSIATGT
jgi:hypothetical protein